MIHMVEAPRIQKAHTESAASLEALKRLDRC